MGYGNYWGFANPDHALYLTLIQYLDGHSFGVATPEYIGHFYALGGADVSKISYDNSVILGLSYFFPMLSILTRIPIALLFSVITASVACVVPASTFVLCDLGLGFERRVSLFAAALTACSSLIAYTFYLHSLGAMTVIATLPVGIAFALEYFRNGGLRRLGPVLLFATGMYFGYFAGFAILGLSLVAIALCASLTSAHGLRRALLSGAGIAATVWAIWGAQAITVFQRLIRESLGGGMFSKTNELLVTFALTLTERGVPFFWGLHLPFIRDPALFRGTTAYFAILFGVGTLLFALLALAAWRRLSGICAEYLCALGAILALILLYAILGSGGYGAFKIIAWIHPLVLTATAASAVGLWKRSPFRHYRFLHVVPLALTALYAGLNIANTVFLARQSLGVETAGLNNAAGLRLEDFRAVQRVAGTWGRAGIEVAVADPVAQAWLVPFLRSSTSEFVPMLSLKVYDSTPFSIRAKPVGRYILHWADNSKGLVAFPPSTDVWRGRTFALSPLAGVSDAILFGRGWYREESSPNSLFEWLHHFRWLRKRAELLILNPSPSPKRLLLQLVSGPGNPSPVRHVGLYLNGVRFDDLEFTGRARTLTRPFVASPPWSQIELAVSEDAEPLARSNALWNSWVPADARSLNVAISTLELVGADGTDALLQSVMDFGEGKHSLGLMDGVYPDGWVGQSAKFVMRVPPNLAAIEIRGMLPGMSALPHPYKLAVSVENQPVDVVSISRPGAFDLKIPVETRRLGIGSMRSAHVTLGPLVTFNGRSSGLSGDPRDLSILLDRVALLGTTEAAQAEPVR